MTTRLRAQRLFFLFILLLFAWMTACEQAPSPAPTPTNVEATVVPSPTKTAAPSPTSTPEPPQAVLLAPPDADQAVVAELQTLVTSLSAQAGLRFALQPALDPASMQNVRIVVAVPPDQGLVDLVAAAPQTMFLAVDFPGLQPAPNLSLISLADERPDQIGFLAGYIAAMITQDWRVGVISRGDTPAGKAASLGYRNGVTYFCGLCLAVYPPFPNSGYPLQADISPDAGPDERLTVISFFQTWQVGTVFVYPDVASPQLLDELAQAGINIILSGAQTAVEASTSAWGSHWVASLGSGDALAAFPDLWSSLLQGTGGEEVSLSLGIAGLNSDLLSPGRQRLAEAVLTDLITGYIDTGVDPQTGEAR